MLGKRSSWQVFCSMPEEGSSLVSKLSMKKNLAQILLVILISVGIPLFSAYLEYHDLAGADFFACDMGFENSDQDNLSMDRQDESEGVLSGTLSVTSTPSFDLLGQLPHLSFTACSLEQKTFTLRC